MPPRLIVRCVNCKIELHKGKKQGICRNCKSDKHIVITRGEAKKRFKINDEDIVNHKIFSVGSASVKYLITEIIDISYKIHNKNPIEKTKQKLLEIVEQEKRNYVFISYMRKFDMNSIDDYLIRRNMSTHIEHLKNTYISHYTVTFDEIINQIETTYKDAKKADIDLTNKRQLLIPLITNMIKKKYNSVDKICRECNITKHDATLFEEFFPDRIIDVSVLRWPNDVGGLIQNYVKCSNLIRENVVNITTEHEIERLGVFQEILNLIDVPHIIDDNIRIIKQEIKMAKDNKLKQIINNKIIEVFDSVDKIVNATKINKNYVLHFLRENIRNKDLLNDIENSKIDIFDCTAPKENAYQTRYTIMFKNMILDSLIYREFIEITNDPENINADEELDVINMAICKLSEAIILENTHRSLIKLETAMAYMDRNMKICLFCPNKVNNQEYINFKLNDTFYKCTICFNCNRIKNIIDGQQLIFPQSKEIYTIIIN